jgi:thioredoxin reductase
MMQMVVHIAYCFHSVDGYSKVGSYTGNGNADGTFVYTGFRPAWILVKNCTDANTSWVLFDNKETFNPVDEDFIA